MGKDECRTLQVVCCILCVKREWEDKNMHLHKYQDKRNLKMEMVGGDG